ncbi:MAG: hypothetical protein KKC84_00585 [Candidatus Omnitrophica bacterium]|nr:hypothetical protein [Candidatus Omnitrophota bacterium]
MRKEQRAQVTVEYFIIFALIAVVTLLILHTMRVGGDSGFQSGPEAFFQEVARKLKAQ